MAKSGSAKGPIRSSPPGSSKKIQRAVRAAASSRGAGERRPMGFPLTVALVMLLGVVLVVLARQSREAPAAPRVGQDHWHSAYGVYDCDRFLPAFTSQYDPHGIHSHQDGVIHIHPFNSSAAGEKARLGVFLESMGAFVDSEEISGPGIGVLEAGADCNGEPSVIRVARFDLADVTAGPVAEYTGDFDDIVLLSDGEAFTIARAPAGAELPPPPEERLLAAAGASLQQLSTGPELELQPDDLFEDILEDLPRPDDTGDPPDGGDAPGGEAPDDTPDDTGGDQGDQG